jgi:hypothetical protein
MEKVRKLLLELERLLDPSAGPWLYGATVPTALDAHLVTFIARMRDVGEKRADPSRLDSVRRHGRGDSGVAWRDEWKKDHVRQL